MCIIMRRSKISLPNLLSDFGTTSLLCTYKLCDYYSPILSPFLFTPSLYLAIVILSAQTLSVVCRRGDSSFCLVSSLSPFTFSLSLSLSLSPPPPLCTTVDGGERAVIFNRFRGVLPHVVREGTHFLIPWVQRPIIFSVRSKPCRVPVVTGSKGLGESLWLILC